MESALESVDELRAQISALELQLRLLKERLATAEARDSAAPDLGPSPGVAAEDKEWKWPLLEGEYERYGRQLILPTVGIQGQLRIKAASVLLIGAGGLGCPAAAYLAGAGVGTIGLVDGDVVEKSNLHRQIAHSSSRVGMSKVDSAIAYLRELNPLPKYVAHATHLTPQNAEEIVSGYDVVLDCTDHPTSRYLISDACVLLRKPLVSASALRTDGQLIVLNCPARPQGDLAGAPCYRCVFPRPPPPDAVLSCGEGGILGPVVGVMGVLQALEALRMISAGRHLAPSEGTAGTGAPLPTGPSPTLLLFSAPADGGPAGFRSVRMRGRRADCFACGAQSELTLNKLRDGMLDYVQFCGGALAPVSLLRPEERITASEYRKLREGPGSAHLLLDVREREHFDIASISGAVNIPFSKTRSSTRSSTSAGKSEDDPAKGPEWLPADLPDDAPIYVVCRVGNDSQIITRQLKDLGLDRSGQRFIGDIRGGMRAWKSEVDSTLPFT